MARFSSSSSDEDRRCSTRLLGADCLNLTGDAAKPRRPPAKTAVGDFGFNLKIPRQKIKPFFMRRDEILGLTWPMVDWQHRCLNLPETKTGQRSVPVPSQVMTLLRQIHDRTGNRKDGLVVRSRTGRKLSGLNLTWKNIREAVGIVAMRACLACAWSFQTSRPLAAMIVIPERRKKCGPVSGSPAARCIALRRQRMLCAACSDRRANITQSPRAPAPRRP